MGTTYFGIEWSAWKMLGWAGNVIFFSRFLVQWYYTEKQRQVTVPQAFWWLSLIGSLLLLSYGLFHNHDSVFIFAYAFTWIPYIRNLVIHNRTKRARKACESCQTLSHGSARFCHACGKELGSE